VNRANDLFLLLLNLTQLRDRAMVTRLFLESLGELFGAPAFELSGTEPAEGVVSFRVATRHTVFGHVVWRLPDPPSAEDRSLLQNAAQMLAVILERLTLEEQLEKERSRAGLLADQRLVELTAAMDQLRLSRNASLNLVEDLTRENAARRRAEAALAKRMVALTRPLDDPEGVALEDLFNIEDIQCLQDQFAEATGVASIITRTDGAPITRPSRFCRLCAEIIRKTGKGLINCYRSDAALGKLNPEGPIVQRCLSSGLWDAGAGISVGGRHIANWLIGQVRDETQSDERMRAYAREIGADEEAFIAAFHEVPAMTRESFGKVARALHTLAGQLSESAYRNVQQARFIHDRQQAEETLRVALTKYQTLFDSLPLGITVSDQAGNILEAYSNSERLLGIPQAEHTRRNIDGPEWRIVRVEGTPMPPGEYASVQAIEEQRCVENVEMGIVKPDGSTTWISVNTRMRYCSNFRLLGPQDLLNQSMHGFCAQSTLTGNQSFISSRRSTLAGKRSSPREH